MPCAATSQQTTVASGGAIGGWVGFKLDESFPSRPRCPRLRGRRNPPGWPPRAVRREASATPGAATLSPNLPNLPEQRSERPAQDNAARGIRTENGGFVSTALGPAHKRDRT